MDQTSPPILKNNKTKIIMILSILTIFGIGLGGGIYYYNKNNSKTSETQKKLSQEIKNIPINIEITGATNNKYKSEIPSKLFSDLTINNLINRYININHTKFFNSISLNNKIIQTSNGLIMKGNTKLIDFLTKDEQKELSLKINYKWNCDDNNKPLCNDNPKLAQDAVCTEEGWICQDNLKCPDPNKLIGVCTDQNVPVAFCDPITKIVSCRPCTGPNPNCNDFATPQCTSTGYTCNPNTKCPVDLSNYRCEKTSEKFFCNVENGRSYTGCTSCTDSKLSCSNISDSDKKLCSSVCINGEWVCKQGIQKKARSGICNDPNAPYPALPDPENFAADIRDYPNCLSSLNNNYSITCTNCKDKKGNIIPYPTTDPNYEKCMRGSCEGHGWVCTENGWVCKPNQVQPNPNNFDYNLCCDSDRQPEWDNTTKCIKCKCSNGKSLCPSGTDLKCGDRGTTKCCDNGECKLDKFIPNLHGCCNTELCSLTRENPKCCPLGTRCKSQGVCGSICGNLTCDENETCIKIDNVEGSNLTWFQNKQAEIGNQKIDIQGNTVRFCKSKSDCTHSNEFAIPAAISNYYPCRPFKQNQTTSRLGYCKSKNENDAKYCYDSKDCSDSSKCEWRDILSYMTSGSGTLIDKVNNINSDLENITQNYGNFCSTDNDSYGRIISYSHDNPQSCNWESCWTLMAQPGIKNIEYDSKSGSCVGIQSCGEGGNLPRMQSYVVNNNQSQTPASQKPISTTGRCELDSRGNPTGPNCPQTDFATCSTLPVNYCPVPSKLNYNCFNGQIETKRTNNVGKIINYTPRSLPEYLYDNQQDPGRYKITELKNLNVDCGKNSVLSSFQFRRNITNRDPLGIGYDYTCTSGGSYENNPVIRYTPYKTLSTSQGLHQDLFATIQCNENEFLNQFNIEEGQGVDSNKIRYKYTCLPINRNNNTTVKNYNADNTLVTGRLSEKTTQFELNEGEIKKDRDNAYLIPPTTETRRDSVGPISLDKFNEISCDADKQLTGFKYKDANHNSRSQYLWMCGKEVPN